MIAKLILGLGAVIFGVLRTCSRSGDDALRLMNRGDDLHVNQWDNAAHLRQTRYFDDAGDMTRMGRSSALDEVYMMSEEAAGGRLINFEANHLPVLEEGSFIRKSYEGSKGLSRKMQLQMMQAELMPPSVRQVLAEPGGDELYG